MSGERFGDGSSMLERHLADRWRAANATDDAIASGFAGDPDAQRIVFDMSAAPGATPLATSLFHLRALRRMIDAARGLNAQDYRLTVDYEKADQQNPKRYKLDAGGDLATLPLRAQVACDQFRNAVNALDNALTTLLPLCDAARADATSFDATAWSAPLDALRGALRKLVLFGAPEALPRSAASVTLNVGLSLVEQGRAALVAARKRHERAEELLLPLAPAPALPDPKLEARRLAGQLDRRLDNLVNAARLALGSLRALEEASSCPILTSTS